MKTVPSWLRGWAWPGLPDAAASDGKVDRRSLFLWALVAAVGVTLRVLYVEKTRGLSLPPDLPLDLAFSMNHPYDTVPREPLFVWWLWGLTKLGLKNFLQIRTVTLLWFFPALWLLFRLAREFIGNMGALIACLGYVLVPMQIGGDANGERHVVEVVLVLLLLQTLFAERPWTRGQWTTVSASLAGIFLTRINVGSSTLLFVLWKMRKSLTLWIAVALVTPAALLLLPHFIQNARDKGDPFYSVNIAAYWFSNKEYLGRPGFPATYEEWQKDPLQPGLTYGQWAFKAHTPVQYAVETVKGFARVGVGFLSWDYFRALIPSPMRHLLLGLYGIGLVAAIRRARLRPLLVALTFLILPYAFVSHVHMAPRFYMVLTPLVHILIAAGILTLIPRRVAAVSPSLQK